MWQGAGRAQEKGVPARHMGGSQLQVLSCAALGKPLCLSLLAYTVGQGGHGQGCWERSIRQGRAWRGQHSTRSCKRLIQAGTPESSPFEMTRF